MKQRDEGERMKREKQEKDEGGKSTDVFEGSKREELGLNENAGSKKSRSWRRSGAEKRRGGVGSSDCEKGGAG
jgi:hypothetical protein